MNSALVKFNRITEDTESSFKGSSNYIQEDIVAMYAESIDRNKRKTKVPAEDISAKKHPKIDNANIPPSSNITSCPTQKAPSNTRLEIPKFGMEQLIITAMLTTAGKQNGILIPHLNTAPGTVPITMALTSPLISLLCLQLTMMPSQMYLQR